MCFSYSYYYLQHFTLILYLKMWKDSGDPLAFFLSFAVTLCSDAASFIVWHKFPLAPSPKNKHKKLWYSKVFFSPQLSSDVFLNLMWSVRLAAFMDFFQVLHEVLWHGASQTHNHSCEEPPPFGLNFLYSNSSFLYFSKLNSQSLVNLSISLWCSPLSSPNH